MKGFIHSGCVERDQALYWAAAACLLLLKPNALAVQSAGSG